jgi:hypothetical protein
MMMLGCQALPPTGEEPVEAVPPPAPSPADIGSGRYGPIGLGSDPCYGDADTAYDSGLQSAHWLYGVVTLGKPCATPGPTSCAGARTARSRMR